MPGTHFEDEALVPEDAKTKIQNVPQFSIKTTNFPPEIPLELEVFQKGPNLIEDKRNDSRSKN
jgi:hypothetical protein